MYKLLTISAFILLCCIFSGKKTDMTSKNIQNELGSSEYEESTDAANELVAIPIFSKTSNINNNLSAIAADISFVQMDFDPPFNDFHISDIALSENHIFLSTLSSITSYDWNGKFIRQIGSRGQGPREYVQITSPLQIDHKNKLIYVQDLIRKVIVYRFDGTFEKSFQLKDMDGKIALIDASVLALRQTDVDRRKNPSPLIQFVDNNGSEIKTYWSNHYPIPREKQQLLASMNPLWNYNSGIYYLEFGADTIFRISGNSMIPSRVLTGNLKLNVVESNSGKVGNKLRIARRIMYPDGCIFESDRFMVFRLSDDFECFYMMYDKKEKRLHRTYHKNATEDRISGTKIMAHFYDDVASGLDFYPLCQSMGKMIGLLPAFEIFEKKKEILDFIAKNPNDSSNRLKQIVQEITEDHNSVLMLVTLK